MSTNQEKIEYLKETKGLIKEAIISKGVEVSDTDTFRSYADKITNIISGGSEEKFEINNLGYMFSSGRRYEVMDNILALCKNVTEMSYAFSGSKELEIAPEIDTSKVTDMRYCFNGCEKLKTVPNYNTSNVTNFTSMFDSCKALTVAPELDTSKGTELQSMFSSCSNLTTLPAFECSNVTRISSAFYFCSKLENVGGFINIGKAYTQETANYTYYKITLSNSNYITHESLMNIINNLYDLNLSYDVANGGTLYEQQLVLGSKNIAKLTAEEIAIATNKGWIVS